MNWKAVQNCIGSNVERAFDNDRLSVEWRLVNDRMMIQEKSDRSLLSTEILLVSILAKRICFTLRCTAKGTSSLDPEVL